MLVKAKFKCHSVTDFGHNKQVTLAPVTSGSEESKSFSHYTPSGNLQMTIDKSTSAVDFFEPQKEYYLTFEACPE